MITLSRKVFCALTIALLLGRCAGAQSRDMYELARQRMVDEEIVAAGVTEPRVIAAMRTTLRHEFVPREQKKYVYYDMALPIGYGQTISPPFIVAYMTEQLDPQPTDRVLEIGTGSGYQAAVLSALVREVYTVEIVEPLGRKAAQTLKRLKYDNVRVKIGDGFQGWTEHAPYDKIMVTCSPENVPPPLVEQLKPDGLMIIPVGERYQQTLKVFTKQGGKLVAKALLPTMFVPMTGVAEKERRVQPAPLSPSIENGSFEAKLRDSDLPHGWYYARQMAVVEDMREAREGSCYAMFQNEHPGRGSQVLQGFAIDGRKVSHLNVEVWVRADTVGPGQTTDEWPNVVILFYDQAREMIGHASLGPWKGTFVWRRESQRLPVPLRAREAVLRIGLLGAVGKFAVDDVRVKAVRE